MVQHNRRLEAGKQHGNQKVSVTSNQDGRNADSESDHDASSEVSCPACGHSFDAGQVAASRDLPHGFSGGDMGGGTEF
jgi:hypothetical protein